MALPYTKEEIIAAYERLRKPIVMALKGGVLLNTLFLLSIPVVLLEREMIVIGYAAFYYLIWVVLPILGILLTVALFRKWQGLAVRGYFSTELKWAGYALASYFLPIIGMALAS